jgi:hypothetical protein
MSAQAPSPAAKTPTRTEAQVLKTKRAFRYRRYDVRLAQLCRRRYRIQRATRLELQIRPIRRLQLLPSKHQYLRLQFFRASRTGLRDEWSSRHPEYTRPDGGRNLAIIPCRRLCGRYDMGSLRDQRRCRLPAVFPIQRARQPSVPRANHPFSAKRQRTRRTSCRRLVRQPAARFGGGEKIGERRIHDRRLFARDVVAGARDHQQARCRHRGF